MSIKEWSLVAGGAGFLGSHLCRKLVSEGKMLSVLITYILETKIKSMTLLEKITLDMLKRT